MTNIGRILIVSSDYPISFRERLDANLVIVIWFHDPGAKESESTNPCNPYFIIQKNRWSGADENLHIPLHLLSKVIENPDGCIDKWIQE